MWPSWTPRCRQYVSQESEIGNQGLERQPWRASKDAERKKLEAFNALKDKHVNWKSLSLKLALFSLVLAATVTILLPLTSMDSEYGNISAMQENLRMRSTEFKKVLWTWENNGVDERYRIQEPVDWDDMTSLIDPLKNGKGDKDLKIGLINFDYSKDMQYWQAITGLGNQVFLYLEPVGRDLKWSDLYPEWIDEESQFSGGPKCPFVPMPKVKKGTKLDLIAVHIPCQKTDDQWSRDVVRLQLHLAAANVAVSTGSKHVLLLSSCLPIPNLFICSELAAAKKGAWLYHVNLEKLMKKLALPIGSCKLAVPLKSNSYPIQNVNAKREAYATILHSAQLYVCGAIAAAQSIRMTGSTRDLIILVDGNICPEQRLGLESAGWIVKEIQRIRNPKAEPEAYNEWNYSKFRLWQLTDYDKIIFIDADLLVLKNIDFLFELPEISATGNNATLFNSGVMVIEPSNCTFQYFMDQIDEIVSYNGGDQGFLNEIFTWWHRLPKHMNYLKHFWSNDTEEFELKTKLFGADPPELYVLHYLGLKPWLCFRDYDCNWNVGDQRCYASDVAHERWWKVHDQMPSDLQKFCLLRSKQKAALEWDRRQAEAAAFPDEHWKRNITDARLQICFEEFCFWESMLWHWGDPTYSDKAISSSPVGTATI